MKIITFFFILLFYMCNADLNAQCTTNIASYKVYEESFSSGSTTTSVLSELKLDNDGHLCLDFASMIDSPEGFSVNVDATQGNNLTMRRQAMVFYHIAAVRAFANNDLPSSISSALDGNLQFKVEDVGEPLFMIDKSGSIVNIDYRKRDSQSEGGIPYSAFAEDAFAIASGYFQAAHKISLKEIGGDLDKGNLPQDEGVQYSISDYLAYRYMSSNGYNTGTGMYVHAGVGSDEWSTLNIDYAAIDYKYGDNQFNNNKSSQQQSELLSASLYHLTDLLSGNGLAKVDAMVINSLVNLNESTVGNQGDAARVLYSQAVANGLDDTDLCIILEFFTEVYGLAFFDVVKFDEENISIPASADGDIYIKDNADHEGEEITTGSYTNSPSIWNRHLINDFAPVHQNPYAGNPNPTTQYVIVAFDGDFCDIQGLPEAVGDVKFKIYRSVPKLGYLWSTDWDNVSVHNDPEGDLIGTFYTADPGNTNQNGDPLPTFRDDQDQINNNWNVTNQGNRLVLSFPWEVPDYFQDIWLPTVRPKTNPFGLGASFQDAFLVRVESTVYDPIANGEGFHVYINVRNNNNIGMKTSNIVIVYIQGSTGNTPGFFLPNDDDDPDDVIISVGPSTHDPVRPVNPDPSTPEPITPIRPVFNNFMDYGEVRILLDEETHQDWVANGSQGNGFVVNTDNEIIVTAADFTLRGLPRSVSGGFQRAMAVRYYAENGVFTSRTGFDIIAESSTGDHIGSTHFEVQDNDGNSAIPRKLNDDWTNEPISIYPNPADGTTLHLDNITLDGNYTIYGLDGKLQSSGKYTKDQKSLDISALDKGIYFLRFSMNNGEVETKKMIKL